MDLRIRLHDQDYPYQATSLAPPRRAIRMVYIVYAIKSEAVKRIYIGHTSDLNTRLKYHNSGYVKSTAKDKPWRLIAQKELNSKDEARWVERSLKNSLGKRLKWIEKNRIEQ